jgi:prepilin-type N-terminal cleavage/methylation domain-containing protein
MLKYLQKAKAKKGFTMVEMVVVIGVIAIMAAVAVPNFLQSQRRAEGLRHNEVATTFYMSLQQTLLNVMEFDCTDFEFSWTDGVGAARNRVSGTNPLSASTTEHFMLHIVRNAEGVVSAVMALGAGVFTDFDVTAQATFDGTAFAGTNANDFRDFMRVLNGYMKNMNEGSYYAMVDTNFRVVVAYYSKFGTLATVRTETLQRTNRIANTNFGAFPVQYTLTGGFSCTPVGDTRCGGHNRVAGTAWFAATDPARTCDYQLGRV